MHYLEFCRCRRLMRRRHCLGVATVFPSPLLVIFVTMLPWSSHLRRLRLLRYVAVVRCRRWYNADVLVVLFVEFVSALSWPSSLSAVTAPPLLVVSFVARCLCRSVVVVFVASTTSLIDLFVVRCLHRLLQHRRWLCRYIAVVVFSLQHRRFAVRLYFFGPKWCFTRLKGSTGRPFNQNGAGKSWAQTFHATFWCWWKAKIWPTWSFIQLFKSNKTGRHTEKVWGQFFICSDKGGPYQNSPFPNFLGWGWVLESATLVLLNKNSIRWFPKSISFFQNIRLILLTVLTCCCLLLLLYDIDMPFVLTYPLWTDYLCCIVCCLVAIYVVLSVAK